MSSKMISFPFSSFSALVKHLSLSLWVPQTTIYLRHYCTFCDLRKQPNHTRYQDGRPCFRSMDNSIAICLGGLKEDMEKAMTPYSSTLALKIPWMEEHGGLKSMGSLRVRYDWATSLSLFTFMHWRRKWQTTPVFLPGESQGLGSLVGCCLWGRTESDMTEAT